MGRFRGPNRGAHELATDNTVIRKLTSERSFSANATSASCRVSSPSESSTSAIAHTAEFLAPRGSESDASLSHLSDPSTPKCPIGSSAAVRLVVPGAPKGAGIANASGYSAHSLRAGFVTEAKKHRVDEADMMGSPRG